MATNASLKLLDRKRPHAVIMGTTGDNRARFKQDGVYFDAAGNEIVTAVAKPAKAAKSEPLPGLPAQE